MMDYMADPKPPAGITETCRYNMYSAAVQVQRQRNRPVAGRLRYGSLH